MVEQQLLVAELLLQEGRHHLLPPLQVLLQLAGIPPLLAEQPMAAVQGALQRKERKRKKRILKKEARNLATLRLHLSSI